MPTSARSTRRTSPRRSTFDPRAGVTYPGTALQPGDRLYPGGLRDINNIAPRGGFTWNVGGNGSLVIRGGSGLYFSIPDSNTTFSHQSFNGERILVNSFPNDGQPGLPPESDARDHRRRHLRRPGAAAGAVAARHRQRLQDAQHVAEQHRLPDAGRHAAGASRPTSRTGRATTSPVSAIRTWPSTRPPATTPRPRRPPGPIRSSARSSGSSRPAMPTTRPSSRASTSATPATGRRRSPTPTCCS